MNLGFSHAAATVHAASSLPVSLHETALPPSNMLLARTAQVAAQIGAAVSFFSIINTNRHFVARAAILSPYSTGEDTLEQKRAKSIFRKLKTEKAEPSNDQRPDR